MKMEKLTAEERDQLAGIRAEAWAGALSRAQFAERNRRVYSHPYAQRIQTLGLKDKFGVVRCSLDLLEIKLALKSHGRVEGVEGVLIASVVTGSADRRRGYATVLLRGVLAQIGKMASVLYSDVGPRFYERFGFRAYPVHEVKLESAAGEVAGKAIAPEEFLSGLGTARRYEVEHSPGSAIALMPDLVQWDWQMERYRYFAQAASRPWPSDLTWSFTHSGAEHLLAVAPDFLASRLDGLWVTARCRDCIATMRALADRWKLRSIRYWDPSAKTPGDMHYPMCRIPDAAGATWVDVQFNDWW
jgi:hypothetical protein